MDFKIENKHVAKLITSYFPKCGSEVTIYPFEANYMNNSGLNPCMQIYNTLNCSCEYSRKRTSIIERALKEWQKGGYEDFNFADPDFEMFGDYKCYSGIEEAMRYELKKHNLKHPTQWNNLLSNV